MGENKAFNVSIVFKSEIEAAKAGIEAIKRELGTVSATTAQAAKVTDENAAAIDREAASTAAATQAQESYTAAVKRSESARRAAQAAPVVQSLPGTVPANSLGTPAPGPSAPQDGGLSPAQREAIRARYNPIFAMSRQYETELKRIAEAERLEALTAHEATAAREAAAARMAPVTAGMTKLGAATKLTSWEMRGLSIQASDTIQSLALGMPPLQVLMQQGPQAIDQIGGIGRALSLLKSALTLPRVAAGAATAAVVLGAMAWNDYLKSTKEVTTAASGLGRAVAGSAGEMEAAAQTGARAAGISVATARSMEAAFLRTGKIGHENFAQLIGLSKDFGATMGISASAAGDALAEMMRDPAKAANELSQQYGLIDAKTAEHARNLAAQNRLTEAQSVLLEALRGRLASATEATTGWAKAWESVGTAAANAWDKVGGALSYVFLDRSAEDRISDLRHILSMPRVRGRDAYQAELDRLLAEQAAKEAKAEQDKANDRGTAANTIAGASGVNATAKRMQDLRNQIVVLGAGLDGNTGISGGQRDWITADLEAKTRILAALENRQARQAELDRLDIQIQTERNPLLRAELDARRTRLEMADQEVSSSEIDIAAQRARNQVIAQTIAGASSQASAMAAEAAIRGQLTAKIAAGTVAAADADTWMERELTMRPLLAAAAIAEGAEKARLEEQIRKLGDAYDGLATARREAAVNADARASRDRIADLRLETGLIGQTSAARIRAQAAADAERWIRDQGPDLSPTDAKDKRRRAADEAEAQIQRDRMQRAEELRRAQEAATYQAAARLASTPIARAEIEAQQEYARVIAETGDAQEAAARADLIRSAAVTELRAALQDYVRTQDEQIARMRLEASLAGQSAAVRAQAQAAYEAELYIRQQGLDVGSAEAEQLRERARLATDVRLQTERITEAWDTVGKAGENAIDGIVGALRGGDIGGAAQALSDQITGMLSELAITNPLKNALFGSDYATITDAGGLGGIWDRLTGKTPTIDPARAGADAATQAMRSVATMQVTAATVIIGGAGTAQLSGSAGLDRIGAANSTAAPIAANSGSAPLGGSSAIQSQIWNFFSGKGLAPHQIAGIMGNLSAESGFNPLAVGDAGRAYGLFQHNDRAGALLGAIGGKQNLGNVQAQLDFAWKELMTSENGAYQRLMASKNVSEATGAFAGFERPRGWSAANPMGSDGWANRLGAAEQAMAKFGTTTTLATGQLGTMGTGFDKFGQALGSAVQGGGGGGFWGTLFSGIMSGLGIPGFAGGGQHGGGLRIVGENGPELEYTGPSTIVPADLTRRILSGGAPSASMTQIDARPVINITNTSSVPVQGEVQETTDSRGQRRFELVMADAVASGLTAGGGKARRTMRDYYGVKPVGIAR